jgi:putative tryptophan/tyrosine transport system substrate-binding protein
VKRRIFAVALCTVLFALCVSTHGQQPTKIPRIGLLFTATPSAAAARIEALRQGLREIGYTEGKNILIEQRFAEGKLNHMNELAAELVRLKVDVIVTVGPAATRPAKEATTAIPIVMGVDDDPVGNGFVASLARPGGNITGLATLSPEIGGKQLELLKEIVPRLSRVAVLGTSTQPGNAQSLREAQAAAGALAVKLQYLDALSPDDIESVFRTASNGRADAVLVLRAPIFFSHRKQIVDLAAKRQLPAMYYTTEYVEEGGLMTYGVSITDLFRRAATYVDKILKGAKPAELPVEQPTKFQFVINLKTAKQLGVAIPPNVLARADRVIK